MVRRIVGTTGIGLWVALIAVVIGLQAKADGGEQMFRNLPEGWKVEKSWVASREQTAAISRKLGGRISKLTNTILSFKGQHLQVNTIRCPTPKETENIYKAVLEVHNGIADYALRDDNLVVEFVGGDVNLAKKAVYELAIVPTPIETLARDLVKLLANGNFEKAVENFDSTTKKGLPADKLKEVWDSLIAQIGAFVEQTGIRKEKILGYDAVFVTCKFEKAVLDTKVVFNQENQITGLFFVPGNDPDVKS